ncbi:MAG: DNA repair protein RecO [Maricaulaceae bacterium]
MEWTETGVVVAARPHGETSAVVEVFSRAQGRWAGLVRGAGGPRLRGLVVPGARVKASWRARLAEHLGYMQIESDGGLDAQVFEDADALAGLSAACAVAALALPEREPHPGVFQAFEVLLGAFTEPELWPALLVRWEAGLLKDLGYGLDLSRCALTGATEDLAFVSPKTGRAANRAAAAPYQDKLLALPPFMVDASADLTPVEAAQGLALTGYFLDKWIFHPADKTLPPARERLAARMSVAAANG